jgi:hypothetical protein
MVEKTSVAQRRAAVIDRLGGAPGRFVVASIMLSAVWFLFRLYLDRGDPIAAIIALSGLYGALWAALIPVFERFSSRGSLRRADRAGRRRGAYVGLAAGVPYYGALLALCLTTGRFWLLTAAFAGILVAVVVTAVRRLITS